MGRADAKRTRKPRKGERRVSEGPAGSVTGGNEGRRETAANTSSAVATPKWDGPEPQPSVGAWTAASEALIRSGFPEAVSVRNPALRSYARALTEAYSDRGAAQAQREPLLEEKRSAARRYGQDSKQFRAADRRDLNSRAYAKEREAANKITQLRSQAERYLPNRRASEREAFVESVGRAISILS